MVLKQQGPPLSLVAAIIVAYRRLLIVWALPPVLIVAAPVVLGVLLSALNSISNGHGTLLLILSSTTVAVVRRVICVYAPTPKARDDALAQSRLLLPLLSAAINVVLTRYVLSPVGSYLGLGRIFPSQPNIPYFAALRLAAAMMVLGLVVVTRFVGPTSIVRCSSMPLVSNPLTSTIRSAWARCTSLDAVLDFIAGPSDTPGVLIKPSFSSYQGRGRRYQWPTIRSLLAQIVSSILGGTAVAYLTALGWYQAPHNKSEHTDPFVKTCLVVTCVLTSLVQLWLGKSHELDPKQYPFKTARLMAAILQSNLQNFVVTIIAVPLLSIGVVFLATNESLGDTRTGDLFVLGMVCLLTTSTVSVYLTASDEAARMVLAVPGLNLTRLVGEICNDVTPYLCLDVMLNSVLQGDDKFVSDIWTPTQQSDVGEEEVRRNDVNIEQMAHILLHRGRRSIAEEACLEQDVLRVTLLETLGGERNTSTSVLSMASSRHVENIRYWVEIDNSFKVRREPVAVPLVRGLCAYVGGLGEALLLCTQPFAQLRQHQTPWPMKPALFQSLDDRSPFVSWSLPPGAIACADYAITGAARCVVWDMNMSSKAMANWKTTHLSMLVPVVLHSAFRLRCGILIYAKYIQSGRGLSDNGEQNNLLAASNPELRPLLSACDEAALLILSTLKSMDGLRNADIQVQSGCRDWLGQLQARQS